jgi:CheY-like chemotaxis protein
MAQAGGRLLMKSKRGEGTTAELWMPVTEPGPVELQQETVEEPVVPYRNLTALAVDDDALVLMNTVLMLEDLGHTAIEAHSGADALKVLATDPLPDVVITDHAMPQMTGTELADKIVQLYPYLKVIVAPGYAELPKGVRADVRLTKPFSQRQLMEGLAAVLENRRP